MVSPIGRTPSPTLKPLLDAVDKRRTALHALGQEISDVRSRHIARLKEEDIRVGLEEKVEDDVLSTLVKRITSFWEQPSVSETGSQCEGKTESEVISDLLEPLIQAYDEITQSIQTSFEAYKREWKL